MSACKAALVLAALPSGDQETLTAWLTKGTDDFGRPFGASVMSGALSTIGFPVGATTLKEHRAGTCACYRRTTE